MEGTMSDAVIVMVSLAIGTYMLKAFGPFFLANERALPSWLKRFAMLLPTPLLAALVITSTLTNNDQIVFDARIVGVITAMIALLKRVPFVIVIIVAAAATAIWRLLTGL
jgi:branched-subunit amino acid transport protein